MLPTLLKTRIPMAAPFHLVLAVLLLAAAPQGSMKWGLWKQKALKSSIVAIYGSKNECLAQAKVRMAAPDGWRYFCRAR